MKAYTFVLAPGAGAPDDAPAQVELHAPSQESARNALHITLSQISDDMKVRHYAIRSIGLPPETKEKTR